MRNLKATQAGESLISLMVGFLISAIAALAILSMFKVSSRYGGTAGQDAAADAQLSSALLRTGLAVQDAGFNITAAALGTHLIVISGADLDSASYQLSGTYLATGSGNALIWAMNTTGTTQCAGLYFKDTSGGQGGLYYLGPVSCSSGDVSAWNTLTWNTTSKPPQRWADRPASQTGAGNSTGAYDRTKITFDAVSTTSTTCKPFGLDGGSKSGKVVLTVSSTNRSGAPVSEQHCLFNFK
jgi:Tfp pilus assembly protein PilW